MYYVYVLENVNNNGELYIGYTTNVDRRIGEHNTGSGARYTKKKKWRLIYHEAYLNKQDALGREKFLKGGSGRKYLKKQLVRYFNNS